MNQQTLQQMAQGDLFGGYLRTLDAEGKTVFCVADVSEILGGTAPELLLRNIPERHKLMRTLYASGQSRRMWFVTEAGLYRILLRSRSQMAEKFTDWVTELVLPAIRKTGLYAGDAAGLAEALMTSRNYAQVRGLAGSVHGLGHTAMAVCRRSGLSPALRRRRGHEFPVAALDKAAEGRPALRGPLAARPDGEVFFYDRAAGQNGGEA